MRTTLIGSAGTHSRCDLRLPGHRAGGRNHSSGGLPDVLMPARAGYHRASPTASRLRHEPGQPCQRGGRTNQFLLSRTNQSRAVRRFREP